jgi:hypothetical protein
MPDLILQGWWCNITIINVQVPNEDDDDDDDVQDSFYK